MLLLFLLQFPRADVCLAIPGTKVWCKHRMAKKGGHVLTNAFGSWRWCMNLMKRSHCHPYLPTTLLLRVMQTQMLLVLSSRT